MKRNKYYQDDEAEISWFFNDINLTMVIIVLFFAIIFASMVSQTDGATSETTMVEETDKNRPTELSSSQFYGEEGFPKPKKDKGFPVKEVFNTDLILTEADSNRDGMAGNMVWDFEKLSTIRERFLIRLEVSKDGSITWEEQIMSVDEIKKVIDEKSETHNVFVRLSISPDASVGVYEQLRNDLWNKSNAIHWSFFTE